MNETKDWVGSCRFLADAVFPAYQGCTMEDIFTGKMWAFEDLDKAVCDQTTYIGNRNEMKAEYDKLNTPENRRLSAEQSGIPVEFSEVIYHLRQIHNELAQGVSATTHKECQTRALNAIDTVMLLHQELNKLIQSGFDEPRIESDGHPES